MQGCLEFIKWRNFGLGLGEMTLTSISLGQNIQIALLWENH